MKFPRACARGIFERTPKAMADGVSARFAKYRTVLGFGETVQDKALFLDRFKDEIICKNRLLRDSEHCTIIICS